MVAQFLDVERRRDTLRVALVDGHRLVDVDLSRPSGTADCEVRDDWFLEQDVNAWSSLAYVVAGVVLAVQVARHRLPTAVYALAAVVVAEGAGSVLFHGSAGDLSQFLHDVALIAALGFVAGWHAGRLVGATDRGSIVGIVVGSVTATVLWAVAPGATNADGRRGRRRDRRDVGDQRDAGASPPCGRRLCSCSASSPSRCGCSARPTVRCATPIRCSSRTRSGTYSRPSSRSPGSTAPYAAEDPDHAPRMFRRFTDRTIGMLAGGLVLGFHRSVDVAWRERFPSDRPVLVVANHGNGFVDPVVVAAVLGRLPRFLAKAALWKVVIARPFLGLAGVLPVYRSADGDRASNNASVFEACHRELAQGATVAIFPEGTTGDRAGLDRVKSGAARIALGAVPTAPDVVIVPIGMAYESRVERAAAWR